MSRTRRPATTLIGAGRLARALLPHLEQAGYPVLAIAAPRIARARSACRLVTGARATTDVARAAKGAALVLLAVPDREIAGVAQALAGSKDYDGTGRTVLHHSGALGLEPLRPLVRAGTAVGLLHPFQCLGPSPQAADVLPGSRARVDGDPAARKTATRLASDIGLVVLPLDAGLGPDGRSAYHAAASLLSNDLVALLSLAVDLLESAGLDRQEALDALIPLAEGTLRQAGHDGLGAALSGPVVRGDTRTVSTQLRRLPAETRAVHRLLSRRILRLATALGAGPSAEQAKRMRRLLAASGRDRRSRL